MPDTTQHFSNRREQRLEKINWTTTTPQERALLQRVEQQIFSKEGQQPKETNDRSLMWLFDIPAVALLIIFLLFGISPSPSPSQQQPTPKTKTGLAVKSHQKMPLKIKERHVSLHQIATIGLKKHWKTVISGGTKLRWRANKQRVEMTLHQGFIRVRVTPKTMHSFVIKWQGEQRLVVKGTRFTVEHRANWLRLEVTKGVVAVKTHRTTLLVRAGQGVRLLQKGRPLTYPVRPKPETKQTIVQMLSWYAKHDTKQLCLLALDWSQRPQISIQKKRDFLSKYAYRFQDMKRFGCSMKLFLRLYSLRQSKQDGELALISAAQSCRSSKKQTATCTQLYRQYLSKYPTGFHRSQIRSWLQQALKRQK